MLLYLCRNDPALNIKVNVQVRSWFDGKNSKWETLDGSYVSFVTNIIFTSVYVVHILTIAHNLKYPPYPSIRIIKKDLRDIDFPVSFKLCMRDNKDIDKYIKLGYVGMFHFFSGQSMFNNSMIGWNGHTQNYSTLMTAEGLVNLASLFSRRNYTF